MTKIAIATATNKQYFMLGMIPSIVLVLSFAFVRYPVGAPVPTEIYTAVCDPCDPIYKFIGPAPAEWTDKFGDSERTRLIHSISELRVVMAMQGKRLHVLENSRMLEHTCSPGVRVGAVDPVDPNEVKP